MTKNHFPIKSFQNGQAIVEYILILTVVVLIGGGLLFKFSKGFQAFGNTLFGPGGTIECLLQTGLLPAYARNNCKSFEDAKNDFKNTFDKENLKNSPNSSSSTPSSSTPSDNEDSSPSNSSSSANTPFKSKKNLIPTTSGTSNIASRIQGPSGSLTALNSSTSQALKRRKKIKKLRNKKTSISSGFKKNKGSFKGYHTDSGELMSFSAQDSIGFFIEDEEKQTKKNTLTRSHTMRKPNQFHSKKKPMLIQKKLKNKKQKDLNVGGWSFGNMLRVVMILAILLIIGFIIFNQVHSVRKSLK